MVKMDTEALTRLSIFAGLPTEAAESVCDSLLIYNYKSDQTILTEGDQVQALWIITEGNCVVSRCCRPGDNRILAELTQGDVFGEMSFVRDAPHSASIQTTSDVTVGIYRKTDFEGLMSRDPGAACQISTNIAAVLAERLRRMDNWVCDLVDTPQGTEHRDEWQSFRSAVYTNWKF